MSSIEATTGEVIARAVIAQAKNQAFGVLVKDMPAFDPLALLRGLSVSKSRIRVRLAMAGYSPQITKSLKDAAAANGYIDDTFVTTVEGAERWRNKADVKDPIIVVTPKDLAKLTSLNRFKTLRSEDLYDQLCTEGREKFGVNDAQRQLWKALQHKKVRQSVPLEGLLAYFSVLSACVVESQIPDSSKDNLYSIGLLPDSELFVVPTAAKISQRLEENRRIVGQIEVLSKTDRQRISKALAVQKDTTAGAELQKIYRKVMEFYREQDPARLSELSLQAVKRLFQAKIQADQPPTGDPTPEPGDDTNIGGGGDDSAIPDRPTRSPTIRCVDFILDGNDDALDSLGEAVDEAINAEDDDDAPEVKDPESGAVLNVESKHPFLRLVELTVGEDAWGGKLLIPGEAKTLDEALAQVEKADRILFNPADDEFDLRGMLQEVTSVLQGDTTLLNAFDSFKSTRLTLAAHVRGLVLEPLIKLNSSATMRAAAQEYLRSYEVLVEGLKRSYEAISESSPDGVQILCSRFLSLDTIILQCGGVTRVVLSPLHPLHLWKFIELSHQLRIQAGNITQQERDLLRSRVEELPNFLTTLFVPALVTGGVHQILPEAGVRQGIPYFELAAHQYAGRDGLADIAKLFDKFCTLHPHARLGLRLAFIDPPDIDFVLKEVVRLTENSASELERVHVRLFFTQRVTPAVGALGGGAEDEEGAERFKGIGSAGGFTLEVDDEVKKIDQIAEDLKKQPAHIAVLFDPSNAKTLRLSRMPSLAVHPICLPMQFKFDKITKSVRVVPAADGGLFGDHNDLRNRVSNVITGSFYGVAAELRTEAQQLQKLTQGCVWLVVADRAQEGALSIGVPRISLKRAGKRDITVYARDKAKFVAEFDRQLRKANYTPSKAAVERLIDDLGGLLTDGLLALVSKGGTVLDESRTQGLVGTLVSAAWYRRNHEKNLLVSIDSPEARRWLELREDATRADLFGICDEADGSCVLDIIEVKTYAEPDDAYHVVNGEVSGKAVDQLVNTARIIDEIFQLDPGAQNIVAPQRREVLRQHLFRECFLEGHTDIQKDYWSQRLNAIFALDVKPRVRLSLAVVGLTQSRQSSTRILKAGGRDVRLIELTEDEVRRHISDQVVPLASSPAAKPVPPDPEPTPTPAAPTRPAPVAPKPSTRPAAAPAAPSPVVPPTAVEPDGAPVPPAATAEAGPDSADVENVGDEESRLIVKQAEHLKRILREYGVQVQELDSAKAQIGPSVIRYRVRLKAGSQVNKLRSRAEDIGRELASRTTPFIDNIAGENYVGIDLERPVRQMMPLQAAIDELAPPSGLQLPIAVGVSPSGEHIRLDIVQLPHLLVAGSTMSGKTVFLHAILLSLISKLGPDGLELIIIDPKATDFVLYNGLPYLRGGVVITEAEDAIEELRRLTGDELRERTRLLQTARCPNVSEYNLTHPLSPIKPIVVVIDEYADLMAVLSKKDRQDFEREINRLAQRARSVGIHLILATQRPTADIVTGLLKANMPCRVSFRLPQRVDSQTILDQTGAENLFGKGDMLLLLNDRLLRLQGYFMPPTEMSELLTARFPGSGMPTFPDPIDDSVDLTIDDSDRANHEDLVGEVTGLTVDGQSSRLDGGAAMTIEVVVKNGEEVEVTGSSGEVLKQSIVAAWRHVQQSAKAYGIPEKNVKGKGVSVHLVNIAEYREAPSAGLPFVAAMVSALTNRAVRRGVALTGEVSLKGKVGAVGGIPQKIVAAYRAGRQLVVIPAANAADLRYVPAQVADTIEVKMVDSAEAAISAVLVE
jgi:DNA segregation ATPase FtsK/SpoIIIE-like protein